jgi:hypothetical protein
MIVVAAGALFSGCQRAAWILNPSIALIARYLSDAPDNGSMSSGSPAGGGAASYSMLAAICAASTGCITEVTGPPMSRSQRADGRLSWRSAFYPSIALHRLFASARACDRDQLCARADRARVPRSRAARTRRCRPRRFRSRRAPSSARTRNSSTAANHSLTENLCRRRCPPGRDASAIIPGANSRSIWVRRRIHGPGHQLSWLLSDLS